MRVRTRKLICRTAFLGSCLLPTLVVLGWVVSHYLPGSVGQYERQLEDLLGLDVSLARVRYPRPELTVVTGLTLADPETGQTLLAANTLRITRTRQAVWLRVSDASVTWSESPRLWATFSEKMRSHRLENVRLVAGEVALQQGDVVHTARNLHVRIEPRAEETEASASFVMGNAAAAERMRLRIIRHRNAGSPTTSVELDTAGTALPCRLLAAVTPAADRFGAKAQWRGAVWARRSDAGWQVELAGEVAEIELAQLVAPALTYRLDGPARLLVNRAQIRGGKLVSAAGLLEAGPGTVDPSLVRAAVEALGCVPTGRLAAKQPMSYDKLSFVFTIDGKGVFLRGACPGNRPRAVLAANGGVLLEEPQLQPLPVVSLLYALAPTHGPLAPVTEKTAAVAQRLPLPGIERISKSEDKPLRR